MYFLKLVYVFSSSYLPLFIIVFLSNLNYLEFYESKYKCCLFGEGIEKWVLISLLIGIVLIVFVTLYDIVKPKISKLPISNDVVVSYTDYNFLNYFGTFIIPLATFNPQSINSVILNSLLMIFVFIFYIQTNSFYYNIFSMAFNRSIFKDQHNNYYISDFSLRELEDMLKLNNSVNAKNITNKVHLILRKNNKC